MEATIAELRAPTGHPSLCHHRLEFGYLVLPSRNTASCRHGSVSASLTATEEYEKVVGLRGISSLPPS